MSQTHLLPGWLRRLFKKHEHRYLDRLLSAAKNSTARLHLVTGVPPAFRVNGEIIIADEERADGGGITRHRNSLLNEQQKKKFEQEWELCISVAAQKRRARAGDVLQAQRAIRK